MKVMTFILLIVCISFYQCEKSTTSSDKEMESVILPLNIGNYWIGLQDSTYISEYSIDTVYIINNEKWYSYGTLFLKNENTGLWSSIVENDSLVRKSLFLKYPAEVNDSWSWFYDFNIFNLVSKSISISLFDSVYDNCYKYRLSHLDSLTNNWYYQFFYAKPNIGIVKQEYYLNDSLYYIWEIKEYHLNN